MRVRSLTMTRRRPKQLLLLTAAAALGSTLPNSYAFAPLQTLVPATKLAPFQSQTRLFSSSRHDDGFFGGLKKAVKSILPKSWTQTKEERETEIIRKEMKKDVESGITTLLKDAPLAVRMLGSLVAPIFSSLASAVQEQQQQTQDLLDDARDFILSDPAATSALGEPIVMEPPFSQSSSSMSINGKSSSKIQASFHVQGTRQLGVASMVASDAGIQSLSINVGGRVMDIPLFKSADGRFSSNVYGASHSSSGLGKNHLKNNDVIDVEFVEKDVKK